VGDGWTLLVLRELFYGESRFDGLVASLGIARNTLDERLRRLVGAGVLERRPYQQQPVRSDYVLTERGRDLFGVLAALNAWGDRWLAGDEGAPVAVRHDRCGSEAGARVVCADCGEELRADDVTVRPGPGYPTALLEDPGVRRRFDLPLAGTS
jgi:DNA-binding HxlR family transcriptional regulator